MMSVARWSLDSIFFVFGISSGMLLFSLAARAQSPPLPQSTPSPSLPQQPFTAPSSPLDIRALEARIRALEAKEAAAETTPSSASEEVTKLQLELQLPELLGPEFTGLGPGISRVYFSRTPLSIGGFGDVHYSSETDGPRTTDLSRLSPYIGYRFAKNIVFNSGFSVQNDESDHDSEASKGRIDFAYVDFLLRDDGNEAGFRIGNILIPFGIINLRFEPNLYLMVSRPLPETRIVPSTWNENGVLGFWKQGSLLVQGGVTNGFDASAFDASTWVRAGRQGGSVAKAENAAYVLRLERLTPQSSLGLSFYTGDSSQGRSFLGRANVTIAAAHVELKSERWTFQGLYTEGALSDSEAVANWRMQGLAKRVQGGYAVLSYDLLPRIAPLAKAILPGEAPPPVVGSPSLPVFIAFERVDLQAQMPEGHDINPALRISQFTIGINYRPHPQVVIKTDLTHEETDADESRRVAQASIGFVF